MSCPSEEVLQYHGFNAWYLGLFHDFNICEIVRPANDEVRANTTLVKALDGTHVTAVGDSSLEQSGRNQDSVDQKLRLVLRPLSLKNVCTTYQINYLSLTICCHFVCRSFHQMRSWRPGK